VEFDIPKDYLSVVRELQQIRVPNDVWDRNVYDANE
jgi:hypothetical protein